MKKIILINILVCLALLAAIEILSSAIFYFKDEKSPLILSDSVVDFPYSYYTFKPEYKDGKCIVNSDGLYSPYLRSKPQGTIRVMLVGGSTARGMMSPVAISDYLQAMLREAFPKQSIEVVNAGMSGYVLEQLFIYYQLLLAKYKPDIVVGLNGYNDLMSVKLNRYSGFYSAPQNMRQFMAIREGKFKKTFAGRLSGIFPATSRLLDFLKSSFAGKSQYDYSDFGDKEINAAAAAYIDIVKDFRSFCGANNVAYLEFLQPVKWYQEGAAAQTKDEGRLKLIKLYASIEQGLAGLGYGYSLSGVFAGKLGVYRDDCHVSEEGSRILASGIFSQVTKELSKIKEK